MKKNLIILSLLLVAGFLGWRAFCPAPKEIEPKVPSVVATQAVTPIHQGPTPKSVVPTAKAPIAPKSELDQKLEKGGFGSFAKAHRISVK